MGKSFYEQGYHVGNSMNRDDQTPTYELQQKAGVTPQSVEQVCWLQGFATALRERLNSTTQVA